MRPIYETPADALVERATIDRFCKWVKAVAVKLPRSYSVDWALVRGAGVVAWAETKRRRNRREDYPTLMLSLNKVREGVALAADTGSKFIVVVEWDDCVGWIEPDLAALSVGIGGRKDRNDPADMEPVVHIPTGSFRLL